MDEIIDVTPAQEQPLRIASNGARFGNNIADTIVFYVLIFVQGRIFDAAGLLPIQGADWLPFYMLFFYVLFLTLFEFFSGKTPGKFLTRTHVVKEDGSRPDFLNLLGRNTARLIPFNALSFLFADRGWHDSLSGTYVVYDEGRS